MGIVLLGSILSALMMVLTLLYTHWFYNRKLRIKDEQINALQESLTDLKEKMKDKERRNAFRISLHEQKCTFEFIDFGDKLLEPLKHRKGEGKIRYISRTGLQMICDYDLPVRKQISLQLYFVLQNEEFSFKGKIVRKVEQLNNIVYGIEFIEVNDKEQQRLHLLIQQMEIERRKKTKDLIVGGLERTGV